LALVSGVFAGAVLTPIFLPRLPGWAFSLKGVIAGLFPATGVILALWHEATFLDLAALSLLLVTVSSFLAMNFTGSTPFTSPTGVEKEMRMAIPLQSAAVLISIIAWISSGVMG